MKNNNEYQLKKLILFIQSLYNNKSFIPLHEPKFIGNEKKYLIKCIDESVVSSIGEFVNKFEKKISEFTNSKFAIATVNGTSALHICLLLANVKQDDEVITQPLTFVATCNAISYCNAHPIFIDVDKKTMGLSSDALDNFLKKNTYIKDNNCINIKTKRIIKACIPMHTFGHPCEIDKIKKICDENFIFLIEDAAEGLGSTLNGKHMGTFGKLGVYSFNGNKIITAGGGGCIVTNDKNLAKKAKHLSTTAKKYHKWEFKHDEVGYNYRMPNLNASVLLAQLENITKFLDKKRELANIYENFFINTNFHFFKEPMYAKSNYWLNSIILKSKYERDKFLKITNSNGIMTRPCWTLMNKLNMFKNSECSSLNNAKFFYNRVVSLPSSPLL